jgi:electron transfer flavoprotein beta subunit
MPMKLICTVKFVPDPDSLTAGPHRLILNPDDVCALGFALAVKSRDPGVTVEAVTLGPLSVRPHMEDLLRLAVDRGTLIWDPGLEDSDAFVTSHVLSRYIAGRPCDCVLTGSHSLDGGSAQVPVQIAESLGLDQMLGVIRIDPDRFDPIRAVFQAVDDTGVTTWKMAMPGVLSLTRESGYKLPYPTLTDLRREVSEDVNILTSRDLGFSADQVGRAGARIRVAASSPVTYGEKDPEIVGLDNDGITKVVAFLKKKGVCR